MAKKEVAVTEQELELVQLDPAVILASADENARFGLKAQRVKDLAADILEKGIMQPVEVEPLEEPVNGCQYRLTTGFYRHAAVTSLNKEGAGLSLPAIVHSSDNSTARLRRQLAENMERENQSPMDKAVAINKLVEAGVPKPEIRNIFRTVGGRKGNQVQPASNSYINILLSFLEFPKAIQAKLHEGTLGVAAGYELAKLPKDKWQAVLDRAEAERVKAVEREEADDNKLLEEEKRRLANEAKAKETEAELEKAKKAVEEAAKAAADKSNAAAELYKAAKQAKAKKDKEEAEAAFKAAEEEQNAALKASKEAEKAVEKLEGKAAKIQEQQEKQAARLKAAREALKGGKKEAVSSGEIQKAAAKEGVEGKAKLKGAEMREYIRVMSLPGNYPKVQAIGEIILKAFDSEITDKQMYSAVAKITGEYKAPAGKGGKKKEKSDE